MGHNIENCSAFKARVQELIALGVLELKKKRPYPDTNMVDWAKERVPFPIRIPVIAKTPVAIFTVPAPFPYESNKAVPWCYDTKISIADSSKQTELVSVESQQAEKGEIQKVETMGQVGGITRTGRCYTPEEIERQRKEKLKAPMVEIERTRGQEGNDESDEFLKIMKQSEYSITDQLKKTPARISLFSLIMSSETHRRALQEVLDKAYVRPDLTTENLISMVDPIRHTNSISFSDAEIAPSLSGNPRALHITLTCLGHVVAKVLIDGGSALNVLPHITLKQLPVDPSSINSASMTVRAFDGTTSRTVGKVTLPLQIGPDEFATELEVMDINPSYTMLLGRPWIHEAKAVPSTLHQRVKYIANGSVTTIKGEEDILVMKPSTVPYIESSEKAIENAHHSFEVMEESVNMGSVTAGNMGTVVSRIMESQGYQKGQGLGLHNQGIKDPITLLKNHRRLGLGYEEDLEEGLRSGLSLGERKSQGRQSNIPHLKETFPTPAEIVTITPEQKEEGAAAVWPITDGKEVLNNWESESLPDVLSLL